VLAQVQCVYEDMSGWGEEIGQAQSFDQLPANAKAYVQRLSDLIGRPIGIISVGPARQQTILHQTQLAELVR
jgi:adenylosuccinate synthase